MSVIQKILVCLFISCLLIAPVYSQDSGKKKAGIEWMDFKSALTKSSTQPKKIFIDVYTGWCGWCKRMDATTFEDPEVVAYMNKHFYAVKLDAETRDTIVFKDKPYIFKPEYRANEIAAIFLNGQMSYPTSVYLDEKSDPIGPVAGYMTEKQLLPVLKYFAEDLYKTTKWDDYVRENIK